MAVRRESDDCDCEATTAHAKNPPFESTGMRGSRQQCGDGGENSRGKVQNVVTESSDFSESTDVADRFPQKLAELERLWWMEAAKFNVLPLDGRSILRS